MGALKISKAQLSEIMYQTITRAAVYVPTDVESGIRRALGNETGPLSRLHLEMTLENVACARVEHRLACGDTGYPLYYVVVGESAEIEGGLCSLHEVSRESVKRATEEFKLRSSMVHPLTRKNTRTNCGYFVPGVEVRFDPGFEGMRVVGVLKGGGAEVYGSFFKMLLPVDGKEGATRFILDSVVAGTEGGKTCPPSIVGVGIGGTSDICMRLAKEAAVLRPVGSRHPEPEIARYEEELSQAINDLGIGPMGTGGKSTVLSVNVEYAVAHTAALPVAVNINCAIARRCVGEIDLEGKITYSDLIQWSYRG